MAFYKRLDKVDAALWSPDNSRVTELASYTPEQYEQYRQDHPELALPAFDFSPRPPAGGYRGTGNTIGRITGEFPGTAGKANATGAANPEVERNLLEQAKDGIDNAIDDWVERSGYSTGDSLRRTGQGRRRSLHAHRLLGNDPPCQGRQDRQQGRRGHG